MSIFLKVTGEEESFPLYTSFSEEEVKREAQRCLVSRASSSNKLEFYGTPDRLLVLREKVAIDYGFKGL